MGYPNGLWYHKNVPESDKLNKTARDKTKLAEKFPDNTEEKHDQSSPPKEEAVSKKVNQCASSHCLVRKHYGLLTILNYLRIQFRTNTLFCPDVYCYMKSFHLELKLLTLFNFVLCRLVGFLHVSLFNSRFPRLRSQYGAIEQGLLPLERCFGVFFFYSSGLQLSCSEQDVCIQIRKRPSSIAMRDLEAGSSAKDQKKKKCINNKSGTTQLQLPF